MYHWLLFDKSTLDVIIVRLEWLIKWLEREELWKTMSNCFRACYGTRVVEIVDCYEVKIETLSHLLAKSATWSQHKHANSAQVFIAMCPQGVISIVSSAWGGRVSDKHLTVNGGFNCSQEILSLLTRVLRLKRMLPECRQLYRYQHLHVGVYNYLHKILEKTRQLANVQIHIKRVIGATKQRFSILISCIPIELVMPKTEGERVAINKIIFI